MPHLQDQDAYELRYDKMTVQHLREMENNIRKRAFTSAPPEGSNYTEENAPQWQQGLIDILLVAAKSLAGEDKAPTIEKWIRDDTALDRIEDAAIPLTTVRCKVCSEVMRPDGTSVDIDYDFVSRSRVFFFYFCPNQHFPGRAFYTDGTEKVMPKPTCEKCGSTSLNREKTSDSPLTLVSTCMSCSHIETTLFDDAVEDPDFEKDRARFCVSAEEGKQYVHSRLALEQFSKRMEEDKEREKQKDLYAKIEKIEKLTIFQIEDKVEKILTKLGYSHVIFEKAETGKEVVLPFSFQEAKSDRREYDSKNEAKRTLTKALEKTNWRLMSDGFRYRMGQLEGRLKGYDQEEDLLKLVKKADKDQETSSAE